MGRVHCTRASRVARISPVHTPLRLHNELNANQKRLARLVRADRRNQTRLANLERLRGRSATAQASKKSHTQTALEVRP